MPSKLRTWIEIDRKALLDNAECFSKMIPKNTHLMAIVKSNAYGHGLSTVAKILKDFKSHGREIWFGVDSIAEGLRLRKDKIKNPILVLGYTLPARFKEAARKNIITTVSSFESLEKLSNSQNKPSFFIKIDSGMHRQGFQPEEISKLVSFLKKEKLTPMGMYSHLASAAEKQNNWFTKEQIQKFSDVAASFTKSGFKNLITSISATSGTTFYPQKFSLVRIGMGLYGYPHSLQNPGRVKDSLRPALIWKTVVGEIKEIPAKSYVGYELTKQVLKKTKIAILPVGYWHGYDRRLSNTREVLVRGARARVLGRVAMDMLIIDVTNIPGLQVGDEAVLIGNQEKDHIWADELTLKIRDLSHYEFLTRINPLIRRIIV